MTARQANLAKDEIIRIFKQEKLTITIDVNHKVINFLDVTFDLNAALYKPYIKTNDCPQYIHNNSNAT